METSKLLYSDPSRNKTDEPKNEENKEQYFRDSRGGASDARKTEHARDQRDNQKHKRPMKHLLWPPL